MNNRIFIVIIILVIIIAGVILVAVNTKPKIKCTKIDENLNLYDKLNAIQEIKGFKNYYFRYFRSNDSYSLIISIENNNSKIITGHYKEFVVLLNNYIEEISK